MISPRDLAYSLFGGPLILDIGPSINGEIIHVRVQPINAISVTVLVVSILLFASFMTCYLYPLLRNRPTRAAASERARNSDAEQPGMQIDEDEKRSLISWLHFRSRDRFSTHDGPNSKQSFKFASPIPTPPGLMRQPSSFTRDSLIPHLSPVMVTPPPPAYASRPNSPLVDFRFPSPFSSPRSHGSRSPQSPRSPSLLVPSPALPASTAPGPVSTRVSATSHIQFDPRLPSPPRTSSQGQGQGRNRSATGLSSSPLTVRPLTAARRSVSANTLHPVNVGLHVPSRARVYTAGESENGASTVKHVARPTEVGLGIGLAARGRILTRGPSSGSGVGATGVGSPF